MKLFSRKKPNTSRSSFSPYILKPDTHLLGQRSQPSVYAPSMGFSHRRSGPLLAEVGWCPPTRLSPCLRQGPLDISPRTSIPFVLCSKSMKCRTQALRNMSNKGPEKISLFKSFQRCILVPNGFWPKSSNKILS